MNARRAGHIPAMRRVPGGVLAPAGFAGAAAACGIKGGRPVRDDLALVVSQIPCAAAATFTRNRVSAAPVEVSRRHLRRGAKRAVVLNSGNANACTGPEGFAAAVGMARAAAAAAGCMPHEVLVCSTGRIGVPFPLDRIECALAGLRLTRGCGARCAAAIMTTDTFPKDIAFRVGEPGSCFRIGAMAKGAGMICPDMATMLCVATTDAALPAGVLREVLTGAVAATFNRITVDGDTSTNDTVILLANGASGVRPDPAAFRAALRNALEPLARMIVRDGEGTTKVVEVGIEGAASASDARRAARAVANSTLVRCAWAGGDPNWGRILAAIGASGAKVRDAATSVYYGAVPLVRGGILVPASWEAARAVAAQPEFRVRVDLGLGPHSDEVWAADLTAEYVRLNLGE